MAIKSFGKTLGWLGGLSAIMLAAVFFTGCQSAKSYDSELARLNQGTNSVSPGTSNVTTTADILAVGDPLTIIFSDTPQPMQPFEERIKDDGKITLIHNQSFVAAGKSRGDLEREIRERYVPKFFVNLTVTIKALERYYSVDGQVKTPNSFPYRGPTTVLTAIASAGGFTDFAQPKKVQLTHADGRSERVNCKDALKNSRLDLPVYPGDKIFVPRKFL